MASPKKCRAPTCTCLSQTGASLARHFPKGRIELWLDFRNLQGAPNKCRAPTCTCLSQTGASLARHFPKGRIELGLDFRNLQGGTNCESDLNPPFAGYWQSTLAQHLHHGEPQKMSCTNCKSDLNPAFAGFWQSTLAQHLHHAEPQQKCRAPTANLP